MSDTYQTFTNSLDKTYRVKTLGITEIMSHSVSCFRSKLRQELKTDALELFSDDSKARVDYVTKFQKDNWPRGQELEQQALNFILSGEGLDLMNKYALHKFNEAFRGGSNLDEEYEAFTLDQQQEMVEIIMGSLADTFEIFVDQLNEVLENEAGEGEKKSAEESQDPS